SRRTCRVPAKLLCGAPLAILRRRPLVVKRERWLNVIALAERKVAPLAHVAVAQRALRPYSPSSAGIAAKVTEAGRLQIADCIAASGTNAAPRTIDFNPVSRGARNRRPLKVHKRRQAGLEYADGRRNLGRRRQGCRRLPVL